MFIFTAYMTHFTDIYYMCSVTILVEAT